MRLPRLSAILLVFGLIFAPIGASATLLYAGGEDTDFICTGTCTVRTTSGLFRAAWAREAYVVDNVNLDPPSNRFSTPTFSASTSLWIHAQYCNLWGNDCFDTGTDASAQMLRVIDSAGNPTLVVRGTGTAGQVKISSRTAAGVFTDLVTCPASVNAAVMQLDLYVNYGTSGEVTLYNNSVQMCDYLGDVTNGDAATTLERVEFASAHYDKNFSSYYGAWSEVIVATTDTRAMSRFTANTVGNGSATGFSGTNVCSAIWGATTFNDSSFAYSGSDNVVHECTVRNSIPGGAFNVVALVMSARVLVGTAGPLHFNFITRTNGTDYASGDFAPLPSFSNITNYIQTVNPETSAPWSVSDFTASGFNVGEKTKP